MKRIGAVVLLCALSVLLSSFAYAVVFVPEPDFPKDYQTWPEVSKVFTCTIRPDVILTEQVFGKIHSDIKRSETALVARLNDSLLYYQYTIGNSEYADSAGGRLDADNAYVPYEGRWLKFVLTAEGAPQKFEKVVSEAYERLEVSPADFVVACRGMILDVQDFYKILFRKAESVQ